MLYFTTRMTCPKCCYAFDVWFESEAPPEPDTKYRVCCPMNASPYVLPFSRFKPTDAPKGTRAYRVTGRESGQWLTDPLRDGAPRRRWWQFWK